MKQTSLIVEFLIIGLIALVNLGLIYMIIFKIEIEQIQINLERDKELAIPIGTFLIYILGAVTNRLSELIKYNNFVKIASRLNLTYNVKDEMFKKKYHYVYQHGSDNVIERVFYNEGMLRLFKSTTVLFFMLGILIIIWAIRLNKDISVSVFVSITCIIVSILCLMSHNFQSKSFYDFINGIHEILVEKKSTINKNKNP